MAKRHHSSKMHVSEGAYAGESARVRMEHHDGGMIMEDHSAVANLPQNVMIKPWEREENYMPENLTDDIRSVDRQINLDKSKRNAHLVPKKV
jgi:hypothetical protein